MKNLDWQDLNIFEHVARLGSIRQAAAELTVHHSTLSRHIDRLEQALGTRLFDRLPGGLVLTAAGEALFRRTQKISDDIVDAKRLIIGQDEELTGTVTVTMVPPIAEHIIAPRLHEFSNAYPNVNVRLISVFHILDLSRMQADVAIRMDNNPPETLVGKRLYTYYEGVYCAPDYLEANNIRERPENGRWIRWDDSDNSHPEWVADTAFSKVPARGFFPDLNLQAALARAGYGLAQLPCLVGDSDPGLVRAGDEPPKKCRDVWLLTHADLRRTARVRAFLDFAETVLRDARPLLTGELGARAA